MNRPYIVCHMLTSINGKISGEYMSSKYAEVGSKVYETINDRYHSQAWLCGRVTMEENFTNFEKPLIKDEPTRYPREDFVAVSDAEMYIVSADPSGKVGWTSNSIHYADRPNAHIIEILTDKVSEGYLSFLRDRNISYLFAGQEKIDCIVASEKLYTLFAIKTLMVSGGGVVNWSFLEEGLIDEVSLVVAPVTDGERTTHTIFENANVEKPSVPIGFKLKNIEIIEKDTVWLTYFPT